MILTFVAWGPLPDSPSSYSTRAPSARVRNPSPEIPEKWTNASFPPSSGVMNPNPFSSLNHLTTPVAIQHLLTAWSDARGGAAGHCLPACFEAAGTAHHAQVYNSARGTGPPPEAGVGSGGRGLVVAAALRRRLVLRRVEAAGRRRVRVRRLVRCRGGLRLRRRRVRRCGRRAGGDG